MARHSAAKDPVTQSFSIYVTDAGSPLTGARACLWKRDNVYEVGETANDGLVAFTISPADSGAGRDLLLEDFQRE